MSRRAGSLSQASHRLIPQLIVDRLAEGETRGHLDAAGLYLDLSGFTSLTESLIAHGPYGAEVLADLVETIFDPLVASVFAQGGFITNYAGDAFAALFPQEPGESEGETALRAVAAAWQMREHLASQAHYATRLGEFEIGAKIGLALGEASWGILQSGESGQALYYFKGQAVSESALAENQAAAGQIVATPTLAAAVAGHIETESTATDHLHLVRLTGHLPPERSIKLPSPDPALITRFYPDSILTLPFHGEFRQALSLFINLRGEPDFDELRLIASTLFLLRDQYGGVYVRISFDDKGCNFHVFWGAPTSQENDVERALSFVLDLRRSCAIDMRAGLTYRIAYTGYVGSPLYEEYTCYGQGVNTAARQMMAADWGGIWLDAQLALRAERRYVIESAGSYQFKGMAKPQPVYRLIDARLQHAAATYRGSFVGRDRELAALEAAIQPLQTGRFAGAVTVVGEPGVGKSRLISHFLATSPTAAGALVLLGRADDILRQPLNAFSYALGQLFHIAEPASQADNQRQFDSVLDALISSIPDADLAAELDRTRSFLAHLVELPVPDSLFERVDPELRAENTSDALKNLFRALSLRQPLIIHLEDAHALDGESRAFLHRLTRNMERYPIAILLGSRETSPDDQFADDASHVLVDLQPLERTATRALVNELADITGSEGIADYVVGHAGGNPLFVEQMLLYLQDDAQQRAAIESHVEGGMLQALALPTDIHSLMVARLDQAPRLVREATQVASVLGQEFDLNLLRGMLQDPPDLAETMVQGRQTGIWYPVGSDRFLFRHALMRDAAYSMQLHSRLRYLHRQAAAALEKSLMDDNSPSTTELAELAYHYDRADMKPEAAHYYGRAGTQSAEGYNNELAISYYSRALELLPDSDSESRYALLTGREAVYGLLGRRAEQQADLAALAKLMEADGQPHREAELALRRASFALLSGDYDQAVAEAEQSAVHAIAAGDPLAEARAYHRIGRVFWQRGRMREADSPLQRALTLARESESLAYEAECLFDLGTVRQYEGQHAMAIDYAQQALALFDQIGDLQGEIRCINLLGMIYYGQGDFVRSVETYQRGLGLSREAGWRYAETTLLLNISNNYFDLGDYPLARVYQEQAIDVMRELDSRENDAVSLDTLGLIAYFEGDLEKAQRHYADAIAIDREIGNERNLAYVLTHLGQALVDAGEAKMALATLDEALALRSTMGMESAIIDTRSVRSVALAAVGREQEAISEALSILDAVAERGVEGLEFPVQVYLYAYRLIAPAAGSDVALQHRAADALEAGYTLLQERAATIRDPQLRQSFLTAVTFNRELAGLWQAASRS